MQQLRKKHACGGWRTTDSTFLVTVSRIRTYFSVLIVRCDKSILLFLVTRQGGGRSDGGDQVSRPGPPARQHKAQGEGGHLTEASERERGAM